MNGTTANRRPVVLAIGFGMLIAILGGLMGLGGAEFRLPVLIGVFGFAVRRAVPLNLLVSLATILVSLTSRLTLGTSAPIGGMSVEITAIMAGAVAAAWVGTGLFQRIADHTLERIVAGLLLLIAAILLGEAALPDGVEISLPADAALRATTGILAGLAIGLVSSLLGVAGGELIIPTLVLLFGTDIKAAGTASLIISLPTVLVGVIRYHRQNAYSEAGVLREVVVPMAAGSVFGAVLGATLLGLVSANLLMVFLGGILAVSAVKMFRR